VAAAAISPAFPHASSPCHPVSFRLLNPACISWAPTTASLCNSAANWLFHHCVRLGARQGCSQGTRGKGSRRPRCGRSHWQGFGRGRKRSGSARSEGKGGAAWCLCSARRRRARRSAWPRSDAMAADCRTSTGMLTPDSLARAPFVEASRKAAEGAHAAGQQNSIVRGVRAPRCSRD
jgi:hypothetical protein